MGVKGIAGMSGGQLDMEIGRGGRFVVFEYAISLVLITFKRRSDAIFIKAGEGTFFKALPYILLTLVLGWWGFPWGPIYSISALVTNLRGGLDVTGQIHGALRRGG